MNILIMVILFIYFSVGIVCSLVTSMANYPKPVEKSGYPWRILLWPFMGVK